MCFLFCSEKYANIHPIVTALPELSFGWALSHAAVLDPSPFDLFLLICPLFFTSHRASTSLSLPCTFSLPTFVAITTLPRSHDICSTSSTSPASPGVIGDSLGCRSRTALTSGTVRSIYTQTLPRITLVRSCLNYFLPALSRDGSISSATEKLGVYIRPKSTSCLHRNPLRGKKVLPAKRHWDRH